MRKIQWNQEQIKQIIRLYTDQRKTINQLAVTFNVGLATIHRLLRQLDINIRSRSQAKSLSVKHEAFSTITQQSAYWIGFLIADGCVTDKNTVALKLSYGDKDHIKKFKIFTESQHKVYQTSSSKESRKIGVCGIMFKSENIAKDLSKYGITPRKTHTAKVSAQLVLNKDFWRGVIDGDGCISLDKRYRNRPKIILVGSDSLMTQFHIFISSIFHQFKGSVCKHGKSSIYKVQVSGSQAVTLVKHLYNNATTALTRKAQKAQRITQEDWKPLKKSKQAKQ